MEILTSVASAVGGEIANNTLAPLGRQIGYLIFYNSNISNLTKVLEKLVNKKTAVDLLVDAAERNLRNPLEMKTWQQNVDVINGKVINFLEEEIISYRKCLNDLCPNPKSRYLLSKKARKMKEEIIGLLDEALKFSQIDLPAPLPTLGSTFNTEGTKEFESRNLIMNKVLEALRDDSLSMISICGQGGVGKTTMVEKLVQIVETQKLFDEVAMAVVSQNPDVRSIQGDIAFRLGLSFSGENEQVRAQKLHERIISKCEKKILLIRDDVWTEADFRRLQIPSAGKRVGYKILLTSRREDECQKMGSLMNFRVDALSDEEGWNLFKGIAFAGNSVNSRDNLHQLAKQVSDECDGLPIAIVTIAKALKGRDIRIWADALNQLQSSNLKGISGMEKVYSRLELSYNLLQREEAKSCFLLCCLFPEDYSIRIEDLVRYAVGLRLLDNVDTIIQARNRVFALIDELKESFLLFDNNKHEEGYVKMHDVVRDVAISIAARERSYLVCCDNSMSHWPKRWQNRYKSCTAISLWCEEIQENPMNLECPKLELLQLQPTGFLPSNFFKGMKELKVVDLKGSFLPDSLAVVKKVRTLHLSNMEYTLTFGNFKNVEILKIGISNNLERLPDGVGLMENLRLLDLRDLFNLKYIPEGVLLKLSKLEELYVNQYYMYWASTKNGVRMNPRRTEIDSSPIVTLEDMVRNNASLKELESLPLTTLEIGVSYISELPRRSSLEKLVNFKISRNVAESSISQKSGNSLSLAGDAGRIISSGICVLLKRTEHLEFENVKNLKNDLYELGEDGFPELKTLEMSHCDDIEQLVNVNKLKDECFYKLREIRISFCNRLACMFPTIMSAHLCQVKGNLEGFFNGTEEGNDVEFPNLKEIYLSELPNLKALWIHKSKNHPVVTSNITEQPNSILFPSSWIMTSNLKELILISCGTLKIVFSTSVAEQLLHLKTLQIHRCEQVEYIVGGQEGKTNKTLIFPRLTKVSFMQLQELMTFCVHDHVCLNWSSLKDLDVRHCPKIQCIVEVIQSPCAPDQKQILFKIPSEFKELLKKAEEEAGITEMVEFSELRSIKLENMEDMRYFYAGIYAVEFPSLEYLQITLCRSMTTFGYGSSLQTPKLKSIEVDGTNIYPITDLNMTVKEEILAKLHLNEVSHLVWISLHHLSNEEMSEIREIKVKKCNNLLNVIPCDLIARLQKAEILDVEECDLVEEIFEYDAVNIEDGHVAISSHLQQLILANLGNLKHLFNKIPTTVIVFQKLKVLSIDSCESLKNVFSVSIVSSLHELEELRISCCVNLEEVVAEENEGEKAVTDKIVLPQLRSVDVSSVPKMKCFYSGACALELPSLTSLKLVGYSVESFSNGLVSTPLLTQLQIHEKDYPHSGDLNEDLKNERCEKVDIECTEAFMKLCLGADEDSRRIRFLSISSCETLLNAIPYSLMRTVQKLEKLVVDSCDSVEEIFEYGGLYIEEPSVSVIPNLKEIHLTYLPKLRHIFNKIPRSIVSFQKLRKLDVFSCGNLKNVFSISLARDLVQLEELNVTNCGGLEQIVAKEDEEERISNKIVFPQLRHIGSKGLFELKCFYNGMYALEFPLLESLSLDKCYSMTTFSTGSLTTPKLQQVQINEKHYPCSEDLNQDLKNKLLEKVEVNKDEHFMRICQIAVEGSSVIRDLSISHLTFDKLIELDKQATLFSCLEEIKLYDLYNLKHIFNKIPKGFAGFQQLTRLEVRGCLRLENVFPVSMARGLLQLQELQISLCGMEQIIAKDEESITEKIVLPQLKSIGVIHSYNLKCFYNGISDIEMPTLTKLDYR